MYELDLDEVSKARNKRYGYNNTVSVNKAVDFEGFSLLLIQHVQLKYFKNGRANMHIKRSYSVVVHAEGTQATSFDRHWLPRKADANKYFNTLKSKFKTA